MKSALRVRSAGLLIGLVGTAVSVSASATPAPALADEAGTPSYIRGVVVNAANGNPVAGVLVTIRDIGDLHVVGSDTTNANGVYRVDDLTEEEYAVKFNGRSRGFETGFLACNHTVVPTWGEACVPGTGNLRKARLDRI